MTAWINGNNPRGVGIGAGCHQRRGVVGRRPQKGRPHPNCGPASAAKFLLLNQQVVRATAMAAWNAYMSNDGTNGTWNPVGSCMFGNVTQPATTRPTRATAAREVRVLTRGMDTLVTHAFETLNACAELRDLKTKAEANRRLQTLLGNPRCKAVIIWPMRAC
jgi:hypothetical protein